MKEGPSIEIHKLQADLDKIEVSFTAFRAAAGSATKAFTETAAAFRAVDDAFWASEHRRRIWFWRGLAGDERRLPPMRWNCAHVWWWQAGRRTGELLAGLRHR